MSIASLRWPIRESKRKIVILIMVFSVNSKCWKNIVELMLMEGYYLRKLPGIMLLVKIRRIWILRILFLCLMARRRKIKRRGGRELESRC